MSAVSNYRYRGVSLSHNDPAAQAAIVYDDPQGWYAGAFASTVRIGNPTANEVQGIFFAGYARTMPFGATFEAGIVYSGFTGPTSYAYPEVMLGATYDRVNARMHYSANYYGRGADAFYGEFNAAHRLFEHVQVGGARRRAVDTTPVTSTAIHRYRIRWTRRTGSSISSASPFR